MAASGTRREARERAIELLYEAETKSVDPGQVIDALPLPTHDYAIELACGVADHSIEIDAVLERYATRWPVARMAAMDRTVLRLGVFELATALDVPRGVCLSEAVELGSRYGSTDDTSRFVNGVLAAIADEVRDGPGAWTPIDCVVFDMDGVLRRWTGERVAAYEGSVGLEPGTVNAAAFAQPLFDEAMIGVHTVEEWAHRFCSGLAAEHAGVEVEACVAMWLESDWELDRAMVDIVEDLAAGPTRVGLFSNASTNLETDLETMGLTEHFDHIANSSRLGAMKPDVDAFARVADAFGVDPARTLFVDDRAANVAGAVAAGWHAVEMRGAARFATVLRRLGLRGAADAA